MSATTIDFVGLGSELEQAFLDAREAMERGRGHLAEIRDGAGGDDNGGLARLGQAVAEEARSLYEVIFVDRDGFSIEDGDLRDVRDLRALIDLAAEDGGAS